MSQRDFLNGVSRVVEFLGESALVARDRVKDHEAFDNHVISKMREALMRYLQSQNLTPEEVQRLENKLSSLYPRTIKKTSSGKRRNPSRGIAGNVSYVLPMPPVKSLDERERELIAERRKASPDMTMAALNKHYRSLVTAEYKPPKIALVQVEPAEQNRLPAPMLEKMSVAWRALLRSKFESKGKRSHVVHFEWRIIVEDAGIKDPTKERVLSISKSVREYYRNNNRPKKKIKH
jgi:hypothetical protein